MSLESAQLADLEKLKIRHDARGASSRGRAARWPLVLFLLLLGGGGAAGWYYWSVHLSLPEVSVGRVVLVAPSEGNAVLTASGYVVAQRRVILGSKQPRRLVERFVSEGDRVEKDQIVATLDHRDLDAQLQRAQAALRSAEATVERAKMAITRAEREADEARSKVTEAEARRAGDEREVARYKDAEKIGAVVRKERELAETALQASTALLDASRHHVKTAEANIDWLKKELSVDTSDLSVRQADIDAVKAILEDTVIRAPFAGVVILKQAEVGETLSPGVVSGQVTSGAIIQIADFDTLEAEVDVNEANLAKIAEGQGASIQVDAIPDRALAGRLRMLMPGANRQKATVAAKVVFLEKDSRLKPDLGCKVTFLKGEAVQSRSAPKLLAPAAAFRPRDGAVVAFVLTGNVARERRAEIGPTDGERVEVLSGLREGEELVLSAPSDLRDGDSVRVKR